jgi:hypothetical protein
MVYPADDSHIRLRMLTREVSRLTREIRALVETRKQLPARDGRGSADRMHVRREQPDDSG